MAQLGFSFGPARSSGTAQPKAPSAKASPRRPPAKAAATQLPLLGERPRLTPAKTPRPPKAAPTGTRIRHIPDEPDAPEPRSTQAQATAERRRRRRLDAATIRALEHVERGLRQRLGPNVVVAITDNTSTMLSYKKKGRALYVRAHRMFELGDELILDAMAAFVTERPAAAILTKHLDAFIAKHRGTLTEARADALRIQPLGEFHDLREVFDFLNQRYFQGKVVGEITWTRAARKQRRTSIHMGTYSDELKLIRIHPALDQAFVPRFFVEFVVYHEMLHQVHKVPGPDEASGRRVVHSPAFRRDEARFALFEAAQRWERQNLARLLRY